MIVKDRYIRFVVGRQGSGKTTMVQSMVEASDRLVVFDPRDEYAESMGLFRVSTYGHIDAAMRAGWGDGFRVAFVPSSGIELTQLHNLCRMLWQAQANYEAGLDGRKLTLVVEEMDLSYPARPLPADSQGMTRLCNQGRHVGINLIGVTQRPTLVSLTFRGNANETWVFPLGWADDQAAILSMIGREHKEKLRDLKNHSFIRYSDGQVLEGENPSL